jgi:hypothetical protein
MADKPKDAPDRRGNISRREFARRAAIASAVASIAPASALGGEPSAASAEFPTNAAISSNVSQSLAAGAQAGNTPKLSPEGHAEVEARVQFILAQYGSRFTDEQKTDLKRLCTLAQPPLDRLRAYALENGDNPALYLKPLVEREKDPLASTRKGKTPSAAKKS